MPAPSLAVARNECLPDGGMHPRDVAPRRRQPGADRPHRLVGDHRVGRRRGVGQRAWRAGAAPHPPSSRPRVRPPSRRRRRWRSARRDAPPPPWRAPSRSNSPCMARRSEWPTITARRRHRPASRRRYRRCRRRTARDGSPGPPRRSLRLERPGHRASRVAGGQIMTSAGDRGFDSASRTACASASCALRPFIFQLPATSGRTFAPALHPFHEVLVHIKHWAGHPAAARARQTCKAAAAALHIMPTSRPRADFAGRSHAVGPGGSRLRPSAPANGTISNARRPTTWLHRLCGQDPVCDARAELRDLGHGRRVSPFGARRAGQSRHAGNPRGRFPARLPERDERHLAANGAPHHHRAGAGCRPRPSRPGAAHRLVRGRDSMPTSSILRFPTSARRGDEGRSRPSRVRTAISTVSPSRTCSTVWA